MKIEVLSKSRVRVVPISIDSMLYKDYKNSIINTI